MKYREKLLAIGTVGLCGLVDFDRAEQVAIEADAEIEQLEASLQRIRRMLRWIDRGMVGDPPGLTERVVDYHDQILNLKDGCDGFVDMDVVRAYKQGHSGARLAAAKIAHDAQKEIATRDTRIERLETDLELALGDAERYRWLRYQMAHGVLTIAKASGTGTGLVPWGGDDPNSRIAEARSSGVV